jgi:hypothetical protein
MLRVLVLKYIYYSVRKVSDIFFVCFCHNLVDFNEAHLHEATLNLHVHTYLFPAYQYHQLIASCI